MRQVPEIKPSFLIIGSGCMAKHMSHYLSLLNLPFERWSRKTDSYSSLPNKVKTATHILLLIKDDAIKPFAFEHLKNAEATKVHFSGVKTLKGLFKAHPLNTFSTSLYSQEVYENTHFVIEEGGPAFSEMLPGLPNQSHYLASDKFAIYHALLVCGGNFTQILWAAVAERFQRLGLPEHSLRPYLQRTFENLGQDTKGSLTGPLARGDSQTIQLHLRALQDDKLSDLYTAFLNYYGTAAAREEKCQ